MPHSYVGEGGDSGARRDSGGRTSNAVGGTRQDNVEFEIRILNLTTRYVIPGRYC